LAAFVVLAVLGSPTAFGQQDRGANDPVGSWIYTVTIPGGTAPPIVFQGIETYVFGGGYVETDQLSFSPSSLSTPSHGSWANTTAQLGTGKSGVQPAFLLTYHNFTYDNTGTPTGTSKIRQIAVLAHDGNSYNGSGDFFYYDLDGKLVLSGTFTITANRIVVEAPGAAVAAQATPAIRPSGLWFLRK
jgi:hypothetical protein